MEASQMPDQLRELVSELDRQAQKCMRYDTGASGQAIEGLFTLQSQGADYARALRELQSLISDCLAQGGDWRAIPVADKSLLWKLCAFSRPSGCFADPRILRQKTGTFLKRLERRMNNDDIHGYWKSKGIEQWITSDKPSSISLEVSFRGSGRVQRFALDLADHLEKYQPVICMIGGLSKSDSDRIFPILKPETVLEHLIIQALRQDTLEKPVLYLADTLHSFKTATTCLDFVSLLRNIFAHIPKTSIVLDVSVLCPRFENEITAWLAGFSSLITNLWNSESPRFCQIMLLGPHSLLTKQRGPIISTDPVLDTKRKIPLQRLAKAEPTPFTIPIVPSKVVPGNLLEESESQKTETASFTHSQQVTLDSSRSDQHLGQPPADPRVGLEKLRKEDRCRENIKLAIVCALTLEADAVQALFEEHWEDLDPRDMRSPGDTNAYSFGMLVRFPTVLVHMPGMGRTSASIVATNCRNSFPNLKLALVVGICGGVPFYNSGKTEIVLGDVIISEGLIAHDYGRQYPDRFIRKDSASDVFGRPPPELRSLLGKLKGRFGQRQLRERTFTHLQALTREFGSEVEYLGVDEDRLFEGTYMHRHSDSHACNICSDHAICDEARGLTCEELSCDKSKLIIRQRLNVIPKDESPFKPAIHFGCIACGEQVMKSGKHRDDIANEEGIIAFEMEGAGVWDFSLSCYQGCL
ncbi:hypothetical protein CGCF245_v007620 [Colletotrichum fructicola]|nr:hypothetical protein CGCF245_v007620 [Colletotrichum fructicola]